MFWKYTLFESKLALNNRKNWVIALFFLMVFTLLFMYTASENAPKSLYEQKVEEAKDMEAFFHYMDTVRFDNEEAAGVYELVTKQASLINMQRWYIGSGDDSDQFIEDGLELNELRLQVHELGDIGVPAHYLKSKAEILRETAVLEFIKKYELPLESESFLTSYFIEEAFKSVSGLVFFIVVLIAGSEMLTFEQRHTSILNGFPIPFMHKITSKIIIHFILISVCLLAGFLIGLTYLDSKLEALDFQFPILIYMNGDYIAVTVAQYIIYMLLAFLMSTMIVLLGAILCNMIFKHAFATILAGAAVFLIPHLMMLAGWKIPVLSKISYLDFANILEGETAIVLQSPSLDFINGYIWMSLVLVMLVGIIYILHKSSYAEGRLQALRKVA